MNSYTDSKLSYQLLACANAQLINVCVRLIITCCIKIHNYKIVLYEKAKM